jgi:hypothetical protein
VLSVVHVRRPARLPRASSSTGTAGTARRGAVHGRESDEAATVPLTTREAATPHAWIWMGMPGCVSRAALHGLA